MGFRESEVELGKMYHSSEVKGGNTSVCEECCVVTIVVEGAGQRFVETFLHFV